MRKEELFNIIGEADEKKVASAGMAMTAKKKYSSLWVKCGAIAACLAVAAIVTLIPRQTANPTTPDQSDEVMIGTSYLNIYYLSENSTIESKSIEVNCIPKDIFDEWATLNHISDITFVDCVYDNGGTETVQDEIIKFTNGNYYTLTITLSSEFSMYAESENGNLLIEALRQTFYDYVYFDEFNLKIAD